ncbi:MAG: trigger factor [Nitrospinae bacterium]|nr:trigger factor [Nitrospinota bacterium]
MKIELAEIRPCVKRITVEVPNQDVSVERAAVVSEYLKHAEAPGFRKGKVPKGMVEKLFSSKIKNETGQRIIEKAYRSALETHKLRPVGDPMFEDVRMDDNQPFSFAVTVELFPEVTLGDISGLTLTRKLHKVTDAEIDRVLERSRESAARMEPVEGRGVQDGDFAIIDYAAERDGQPVPHFNGVNRQVLVSKEGMLEGLYNGILGMNKGEGKEFESELPKDFPDPELAGAKVVFKIKVNEIKQKIMPPLDDQLAKEVSQFDTLDELKADIRQALEKRYAESSEETLRISLMEKLVEMNPFELPPRLLERQTRAVRERVERRLQSQGLSMAELQMDNESAMERHKEDAVWLLKEQAVLGAYANGAGIEVTDDDIDDEIQRMAQMMGQPYEDVQRQLMQSGGIDGLINHLFKDKAYKSMLEKAKIEDKFEEEPNAK